MRELSDGEEIEVGDVIVSKSAFGERRHEVHRVTKKYCFVRHNDVAEGKFLRTYSKGGFAPLPRQRWSTVQYTVHRSL